MFQSWPKDARSDLFSTADSWCGSASPRRAQKCKYCFSLVLLDSLLGPFGYASKFAWIHIYIALTAFGSDVLSASQLEAMGFLSMSRILGWNGAALGPLSFIPSLKAYRGADEGFGCKVPRISRRHGEPNVNCMVAQPTCGCAPDMLVPEVISWT